MEDNPSSGRAILVGTDGSDSAQAAIRWAALEAHRRDVPLTILHVYDEPWPTMPGLSRRDPPSTVTEQAEAIAVEARLTAQALTPAVTAHTKIVAGDPATVLLQHADTVALAVVGHRGRGGLTSLLLGSVSRRVATHAPHSAVVVRGRATAFAEPVVVGVGSSPGGRLALDAAFAAAASRHVPLLAVHVHRDPLPPVTPGLPNLLPLEAPRSGESAADDLEELLAPWRRRFPAVPVETRLGSGSTARMLTEASFQAQLMVVGARSSGTWTGSAVMQLLHHADCPVMIVRR